MLSQNIFIFQVKLLVFWYLFIYSLSLSLSLEKKIKKRNRIYILLLNWLPANQSIIKKNNNNNKEKYNNKMQLKNWINKILYQEKKITNVLLFSSIYLPFK